MRIRRFFKGSHYGQKGFTLIELLVVVAILGILAAIVVPNVASFIGTGQTEAAATELHNIETAVTAAMAAVPTGTVAGSDGNPATSDLDATQDLDVDGDLAGDVGAYLVGGYTRIHGTYSVEADGTVNQLTYP